MTTEGVDFSRTANSDWSGLAAELKAQGKSFCGRYATNDLAPNGRGIGPDEYAAMTAAGIETFLYWESSEGWMLGGETAGLSAAVNAQQNINRAGMPPMMPIYFACDYDAPESDQSQIDDCLRGCAKVLGIKRVGLYAGYWPLLRAKQNGTARWYCQTLAWSGGRLLDGVHLYQYDTQGNYIDGTDVDLVRAYQDNYGQASRFTGSQPIEPRYAKKKPIPGPVKSQVYGDKPFVRAVGSLTLAHDRAPQQYAAPNARHVGEAYDKGRKVSPVYTTIGNDGELWIVDKTGGRWPFSGFEEGQ